MTLCLFPNQQRSDSTWRTREIRHDRYSAIILGLLAQYLVLPTRMTAAVLRRIPPSMEQAAALCGASWFMTLRYIVAPLAKRGLIAAWIIGYVFSGHDRIFPRSYVKVTELTVDNKSDRVIELL
jgi:ABC-type spermidine/putrescine transport system permease subunit II